MEKEITIKEAEIWLEKLEHLSSKSARLLHVRNLIIQNEKSKIYPLVELDKITVENRPPVGHQYNEWGCYSDCTGCMDYFNKKTKESMKIERIWVMPSAWTFTIKPIKELLKEEMDLDKEIWLDPFAGLNSPAQYKNDLNGEMNAQDHEDAIEWLKKRKEADGVLLDPPYSLRQVSEHYKKAGIKITGWHTSAGWKSKMKDEVARIIKPGGKAICFGWNSMGLGKKRGFEMTRILLVAHGGSKNDTICTVETKLYPPPEITLTSNK